jgi:beta-galactosidase
MQSDILREYVKEGDFITTNGLFGNLDNHKMQDTCLDVSAYDSYPNFAYCIGEDPKHNRTLNDRKWSRNLTEVRSVCPHFGVMEQQSGANGWNTSMEAPAPKPGQMKLWAMQSIMHGADYIGFFRWRTVTKGTEMYWHGILDYDNCDNRKLREVKEIHDRVEAIAEVTGAEYVAPLGLVRDYDNIFDAQLDVWHGRLADSSEMEIFVAAQLSHTPMDAVYLLESTDAGELQKYKVLIYPHAEILTDKACEVLTEYVRQGGCLIIGARTGQKNADGQCVMKQMPGLLSSVTQSVVKEFTLIGPDDEPVSMDWDQKAVETGLFNDILEPVGSDAKVLARYSGSYYEGSPALIETAVGAGKILHFGGTFTRENCKKFLAYTGILNPFAEILAAPESCEVALRRTDEKDFLFVLNFEKTGQTIELHRTVTDMDTGETVSGEVPFGPYETKVYSLS